jgi:hypothetical protein
VKGNLQAEELEKPAGEMDNQSFPHPHSWHTDLRYYQKNGSWTIVHHFEYTSSSSIVCCTGRSAISYGNSNFSCEHLWTQANTCQLAVSQFADCLILRQLTVVTAFISHNLPRYPHIHLCMNTQNIGLL